MDNILEKLKIIKMEYKLENNPIHIIPDNDFMERFIWITNKKAERQTLKLNEIQLKIENTILELQKQGIPPRIVILKARQEGVSTYVQGKMISNTVQKKDRKSLIVAHTDKSVNAIFAKAKFMYNNLPEEIKPLQKASNTKELIFDTPSHYTGNREGLNSSVSVQIAGTEDIARGDTPFYVHLSEYAFWKGKDNNSPNSQLSSIMQAVPRDNVDTFVIIESTAKGFNDFKNIWDEAVNGLNGWTPLFFAWHDMKEYKKEFKTEKEKNYFLNSLDEYEKELIEQFNLSLEQVNWYRHTKQVACNNNHDKMKQENPSYPEEAFIFSGSPVFDNSQIMKRINYLKKEYEINPYISGVFDFYESNNKILDSSIKFIEKAENDLFNIKIYEKAEKGYSYTIGADTKGEGKDFYTATVVNCITQKVVATAKGSLSNSKYFTHQLFCLGKYYNMALIGVEMNFNTAPIERLSDLLYYNQYQREQEDSFTGQYQKKYGWKTTGVTRPRMIDNFIHFSEKHIECFSDIETLQEMLTFVYDENNRPDAMSGKHDDLLFSHMIAMEIQSQQSNRYDSSNKSDIYIEFTKGEEYEETTDIELLRRLTND